MDTNKDGTVTVSIGNALKEVKKAAKEERRSISQQIAVIVLEWLEARRTRAAQQAQVQKG